jgi:hypothetical protein
MFFIQPHVAVVERTASKQVLAVRTKRTAAGGLDPVSRPGVIGLIFIQFYQIHASNSSSQDLRHQ